MERTLTPVILVDHKFQALNNRFAVKTTAHDLIYDLKEKVREERHDDLSRFRNSDLTVWKTKGEMIIKILSPSRLAERLGNINVDDEDTIEELGDEDKLVDLGLLVRQTLLVKLPAVVTEDRSIGDAITKEVDPEYIHCFLKAHARVFRHEDVELNGIFDAPEVNVPPFVNGYEKLLDRKRTVASNMRGIVETLFDEATFNDFFSTMAESPESIVNQSEVEHLIHINSVNKQWWKTLNRHQLRDFKECDAYWLFFSAVAKYYETLASTDDEAKIAVKDGQESWSFQLLIQVAKQYYTYTPKSDFLLLKFNLPRLALEVNSQQRSKPCVDLFRLMLQGASIVRFANTKLDAYKEQKNFVFVAIYIDFNGDVQRYLLYQNEKKDPHKVYRKKRLFAIENLHDRLEFARELYNLSSALHADEGDTEGQVEKLKDILVQISAKNQLTAFSSRAKRPASTHRGDQPGTNRQRTGNGADEQLEDSGYEVVRDILETKGGTWDLIDKPPANIRIVCLRSDPDKTEYIAKRVREGSNELAIHEYLHTRRSQSLHVISLIEAVPSTSREWLILPKLCSIRDQCFMDRGGVDGRVRLGWGLIEGLAYLHEHKVAHRDIKPNNLVCDDDFLLKIIDFDTALKVQDEDMEIDEYCGTEGWTAPEMGEEDGPKRMYSPIKTDRWSCGRVIFRHIMVRTGEKGDHRLLKLANQLTAKDPQERPSLVEWHKFFAPQLSNVAIVLKDRSRRDIVEFDGESVKPPNAKRPRLERSEQPELYESLASRPMGEVF